MSALRELGGESPSAPLGLGGSTSAGRKSRLPRVSATVADALIALAVAAFGAGGTLAALVWGLDQSADLLSDWQLGDCADGLDRFADAVTVHPYLGISYGEQGL